MYRSLFQDLACSRFFFMSFARFIESSVDYCYHCWKVRDHNSEVLRFLLEQAPKTNAARHNYNNDKQRFLCFNEFFELLPSFCLHLTSFWMFPSGRPWLCRVSIAPSTPNSLPSRPTELALRGNWEASRGILLDISKKQTPTQRLCGPTAPQTPAKTKQTPTLEEQKKKKQEVCRIVLKEAGRFLTKLCHFAPPPYRGGGAKWLLKKKKKKNCQNPQAPHRAWVFLHQLPTLLYRAMSIGLCAAPGAFR